MFPMMRVARSYPALAATLLIGVLAASMALLNSPWTQWLVSGFALVIAVILLIGMVRDIIHGA